MASIRETNKSITKKLTRIENSLKNKLTAFYKKKILPLSDIPLSEIKRRYENQVKTIIRKTIQESYLTGNEIVSDAIREKQDFTLFISVTDIQNIASLTQKMSDQFWTTTSKLVAREQEFKFNVATQEFIKKKSFDDEAAMIGLSALFAYSGFNSAILSKMSNIPILTPVVQPVSLTTDGFTDLELGFGIERIPDELPLSGRVMFLTQEDAAVDPEICEPLNRTVYDVVLDVDIPQPPLHRHCRCRLIPIVDNVDLGVTGSETIL